METWAAIILCAIVMLIVGSMIWYELANIRQDIELTRANVQIYVAGRKRLELLQVKLLERKIESLDLKALKLGIDAELSRNQTHETDAIRYGSKISPLKHDHT